MTIYKDLEDSLYNLVEGLFPDWRIIFSYTNGPEPTTPYCAIDIRRLDPVGQQYTSHLSHLNAQGEAITMTIQDGLAQVRFEFHGKYDDNTEIAEMASLLELFMRTPRGFELMKLNRLSLHKRMTCRRLPQRRETDMYMCYQLDCTFAYCSVVSDEIDWIEILRADGTYYDAGREPDHKIVSKIDITPNP